MSYNVVNDPELADIIVINTCAFINDAKQESIETILEFVEWKKQSLSGRVLIVTGCYVEEHKQQLLKQYPEIDGLLNTGALSQIEALIQNILNTRRQTWIFSQNTNNLIGQDKRFLATPSHYAYLKINDGCDNNCSYCLIPRLRGPYYEKNEQEIYNEAKLLAGRGVKELIIIGQDITAYGQGKNLSNLLNRISETSSLQWIRLMYCYPDKINTDLIKTIKNNKKIVKYMDIPIQHISNKMLKKMNRKGSKETIMNTINTLRNEIPDMKLRSTVMTGFPGETEKNFNELYEFIEDTAFDHLGVFTYSQVPNTSAFKMRGQIDEDVKLKRFEALMELQHHISKKNNSRYIGQKMDIMIDNSKGGRRYFDAPEIDGFVYISNIKPDHVGTIQSVNIQDARTYDLSGTLN